MPDSEKQKHTPEPWIVRRAVTGGCPTHIVSEFRDDQGRKHIVYIADLPITSGREDEAGPNANRIVACVNACACINPEAVPLLREALKLMMEWAGPPPKDKESYDSLREDAWRKANTALAEAKKVEADHD